MVGEHAPFSASTVARLKTKWQAQRAEGNVRDLSDLYVVYVWADGVVSEGRAGLGRNRRRRWCWTR